MSTGVEGRSGHDAHHTGNASLAPGRPPYRRPRTYPRIPTSPVTMPEPEPEREPEPEQAGTEDPPPSGGPAEQVTGSPPGRQHRHVLIEPEEDRWAWRRQIRRNPHQLRLYRVVIGIAGLLLICLGLLTGPLPGPGGIPLILLGLAVWSSEFEWAYRLRLRIRADIKRIGDLPPGRKAVFWIGFALCCALLGYGYLLVFGVPFWVPEFGEHLLERLPGVRAAA